jgi:hypothetical protein
MSLKNRRVRSLLFCLYCLAVIGTSAWASSRLFSSQTEQNIVEYHPLPDQPAELAGVTAAGKDIKFNESFTDGPEWLKHLSFTLRNTYSKPITHVSLYLYFPETRITGNIMMYPLKFGKSKRARLNLEESEESLAPGDEATVKFSLNRQSQLKEFLERRHAIDSLHKVMVQVAEVEFADGTYWFGGSWFRIDPNTRKSIRLDN